MSEPERRELIERVEECDATLAHERESTDPAAPARVADALARKADALRGLRRFDAALASADEALAILETGVELDRHEALTQMDAGEVDREALALALRARMMALWKLKRREEAVRAADRLVEAFASDPIQGPEDIDVVASALLVKSYALKDGGHPDAALAVIDAAVWHCDASSGANARVNLVRALSLRAECLDQAGRIDEALEVLRSVVTRFGEDDDPSLRGLATVALGRQAQTMQRAGRSEEAILLCDELAERYAGQHRLAARRAVAAATYAKAQLLKELGRLVEAIDACDVAIECCGEDEDPQLLTRAAHALWLKGLCLSAAHRGDEALIVLREIVARCADSEDPALRRIGTLAMYNAGCVLRDQGRTEEAIAQADRALAVDSDVGPVRLAAIWTLKRGCLDRAGRREEALAVDAEIIGRFSDGEAGDLGATIIDAWTHTVFTLLHLHRVEEAVAASDAILEGFELAPDLLRARALLACAQMLTQLQRGRPPLLELGLRWIVGGASALQRIPAAVVPRRSWPRLPESRLSRGLAEEQQRYAQALKLIAVLESIYGDDPDAAHAQILVEARLQAFAALQGAGRPIEVFKNLNAIVSAGQVAVTALESVATRVAISGSLTGATSRSAVSLAFLRALTVEKLGDHDRTIAAYDAVVEQFKESRSPFVRFVVSTARDNSRKARKARDRAG